MQHRHIRRSIFVDAQVHLRLPQEQIVQRNFASPKRIDAQPGVHFFRGEQRFGAGGFASRESPGPLRVTPSASQWMESVRISTRPPVMPWSRRTTTRRINGLPAPLPKNTITRQNRDGGQHPRRVDHPAPDRMAAFALHGGALLQHFFDVHAPAAFVQPAFRLLVDAALYQRFVDIVARGIQRRRLLPARLRARDDRLVVEVFHFFRFDFHRRAESRVEVVAEIKLRRHHVPHVGNRSGRSASCRASYSSGDVNDFCTRSTPRVMSSSEGCGKSRCFGFVPHDPLIDQTVQNLRIAFGLAIDELLVARQNAHVAQKNDVVFHAGRNAVDRLPAPAAAASAAQAHIRAANQDRSRCTRGASERRPQVEEDLESGQPRALKSILAIEAGGVSAAAQIGATNLGRLIGKPRSIRIGPTGVEYRKPIPTVCAK